MRSVIAHFLNFLATLKLFHWDTFIHAEHVASDDIYGKMQGHVDRFVEVLLGKMQGKPSAKASVTRRAFSLQSSPLPIDTEVRRFLRYLDKLTHLSSKHAGSSDLLNILDEMRADLNQFLYLLSMK